MSVVAESPVWPLSSICPSFYYWHARCECYRIIPPGLVSPLTHTHVHTQTGPPTTNCHTTPCPERAGVVPSASSAVLPDLFVQRFPFQCVCHFQIETRLVWKLYVWVPWEVDGSNVLYADTADTLQTIHDNCTTCFYQWVATHFTCKNTSSGI